MSTQHTPKLSRTGKSLPAEELPLKFLAWFHSLWMWLAFSLAVLILDYLSGPFVHISMFFVFPVAAAAWHRRLKTGLLLALLLPCFRLLFYPAWDTPWMWVDTGTSCMVRVVALMAFATLTRHLRRQADEIHLLRGILPICAHCKKIRDSQGQWHQIESYISSQTEARFSHGICPDCMKRFYGENV